MLPGLQTRALSLRSTSVHMVSSDSSLAEFSNVRMFSASSIASRPRAIVPEIGQVSMRCPLTRTYISGDAPIRCSPSPRLIRKPYGAGLRRLRRRKISDGLTSQAVRKTRLGTTSNNSPRAKRCLASSTMAAYSPCFMSFSILALLPRDGGWGCEMRSNPAVLPPSGAMNS